MMSYYFNKILYLAFEDTVGRLTEELKKEGFGIITQIDFKETLKKKLGIDFRNYKIFGVCNPEFAYKAIQAEDKIGTMLPCNFIVQEKEEGKTEVAAIDPLSSMSALGNQRLKDIAETVRKKLKNVIERL